MIHKIIIKRRPEWGRHSFFWVNPHQLLIRRFRSMITKIRSHQSEKSSWPSYLKCDIGKYRAEHKWEWFEGGTRTRKSDGHLNVANMDENLSLCIPLGLASMYTAMQLDDIICLASTGTSIVKFLSCNLSHLLSYFSIDSLVYLRNRDRAEESCHGQEVLAILISFYHAWTEKEKHCCLSLRHK